MELNDLIAKLVELVRRDPANGKLKVGTYEGEQSDFIEPSQVNIEEVCFRCSNRKASCSCHDNVDGNRYCRQCTCRPEAIARYGKGKPCLYMREPGSIVYIS